MDTLQILLDFFTGYGYVAVFTVLLVCGFGVPIPEDITLVAGGIISGLGYTNVHWMFLVGMAGVLAGDGIMFTAGRVFGNRVLKFRPIARILTQERFEAVQEKFEKYGNWVLFVARFLPGLRSPIFITAGMTRRVSYWRFLLMDGFAALISVPVWVYLGYYGAANREWLMTMVHRGQAGILAVVAALLLGVAFVWMRRRRQHQCVKK
ncbi:MULTISPECIES: DedA family protein [Chromobacterium]|uniref:DedA family protein n=1 Tax=Chromobacterium TaxID=535 RepID=UPI0005BC491D|nr:MULTISPECIES: DedA family protein [Chromobacterium]QOZ82824.1 DedA family protein [Chromobacterium sp. Rain0013]UGA39325.1 DedA family protein [Chromobacterium haemolyticum]WON82892.1 DedA family protein [Chromobacterium haemolyticum]